MIMKIGENAGRVYEYLRGKRQVSLNAIVKGTGLKSQEADRAIGWLAREGKIHITKEKTGEAISLAE